MTRSARSRHWSVRNFTGVPRSAAVRHSSHQSLRAGLLNRSVELPSCSPNPGMTSTRYGMLLRGGRGRVMHLHGDPPWLGGRGYPGRHCRGYGWSQTRDYREPSFGAPIRTGTFHDFVGFSYGAYQRRSSTGWYRCGFKLVGHGSGIGPPRGCVATGHRPSTLRTRSTTYKRLHSGITAPVSIYLRST